jgi:hypothetical protein
VSICLTYFIDRYSYFRDKKKNYKADRKLLKVTNRQLENDISDCQREVQEASEKQKKVEEDLEEEQYYSRKLVNDTDLYIGQFLEANEALRNTVDQLQEHNESLRVIF